MEMHTHLNRCQQEPVSSYTAYLFCEIPNAYLNMVCIIKRPHFSSCLWIAFDWSRLLLITGSTIMVYNIITYASCNRNLICWQLNKRMRSKMCSAKLYVHSNYAIRNNDWIQTKQGLLESKLQGNFQLDSKVFLICSWQEQFPIV